MLCVDYRRLNKVTAQDPYPMPRIDDLLDGLRNAHFISTLDLSKGYWQVPVAENSVCDTTREVLVQGGLVGTLAVFQRMMNTLLTDIISFSGAYIDDVVTPGKITCPSLPKTERSKTLSKTQKMSIRHVPVFLPRTCSRPRKEAKVSAINSFLQPRTKIISWSCRILSPVHSRFRDDHLTPHRFNQERYPRQTNRHLTS